MGQILSLPMIAIGLWAVLRANSRSRRDVQAIAP
jgi:prolipoprotein diacylglyceryltransferase